ncbi:MULTISPECIES: hypothetical protein [unclassified Massilia]|uniref:hypothetical protein n=1 Tax=unclassified Massilia TaxID=2609279 RepID=UPI0012E30362|nr:MULTISPECIES: hypothetical protein [unclassified Massilia]
MAPFESEGSAGGSDSMLDAFAAHFEGSADGDDDQQQAAQASEESQEDAAARLAAEDAAKAAEQPEQAAAKPADTAQTDQPQKFTVEVDGKPIELTAAEMAEHVKNGMRQADYSRKTAEVAEQRKAVDAEVAQARAQRDEYATKLEGLVGQANYEVSSLRAQLTDELLQSDPHGYMMIQRTAETRQAQLQQAHQELQQINGQRQQEQAANLKSHMEAQHQALLDKLPEWKDPAKAEAEAAKIQKFLADQGFKPEEMQFNDHRGVLLARKAMLYDALMARAQNTQSKVAAAPPKVARTGVPVQTEGRSTAVRRFEQTGSRDDAAAAFAEMFG